jgi:hypothetical protein
MTDGFRIRTYKITALNLDVTLKKKRAGLPNLVEPHGTSPLATLTVRFGRTAAQILPEKGRGTQWPAPNKTGGLL